ncbi:hypothetical protein DRH14_02930 [Candidatus Shapirobacteria bacterium]|nr:MAG: hypothetical protein DRH14_02930 [Candidatus Shapirobacteria bacterium]
MELSPTNEKVPPISTPDNGFDIESLAGRFKWETTELKLENITVEIDSFKQQHPELQLPSTQKLVESVQSAFDLADEVYRAMRPKDDTTKPDLIYHGPAHTKLTSMWIMRAYLGCVASQPEIVFDQKEFDLWLTMGAMHEIEDWWNLAMAKEGQSISFEVSTEANQIIDKHLENKGLSQYDYERVIVMDDFTKQPEEVLAKLKTKIKADKKHGKLDKNSLFTLDNDLRIIETGVELIHGTDFLQITNPNYRAVIMWKLRQGVCKSNLGALAFALEAKRFRPKALSNAKWTNEDEKLVWEKVGTDPFFFNEMAMPRVNPILPYLDAYYGGKTNNLARQRLKWIEKIVKQAHSFDALAQLNG